MSTKFHDRKEAGLLLAERLKVYNRNTFGSEEEAKKESFIVILCSTIQMEILI